MSTYMNIINMSNNKLKIPCSKLQPAAGGFDCKEFRQFFDSLANPVPLLSGTTGNALAVLVQYEQF